jgi:hypothetical protein
MAAPLVAGLDRTDRVSVGGSYHVPNCKVGARSEAIELAPFKPFAVCERYPFNLKNKVWG